MRLLGNICKIRMVIDAYITKARLITEIFRMPRQNEESCDGLRALIDTPKMALRQLRDMGERTDAWDLIMVPSFVGGKV